MRNFILGIGATIGAIIIGQKIYDKGYEEALADSEEKVKKESSKKDK